MYYCFEVTCLIWGFCGVSEAVNSFQMMLWLSLLLLFEISFHSCLLTSVSNFIILWPVNSSKYKLDSYSHGKLNSTLLNTLTPSYQISLQTTTKELATPGNSPLTSLVHSVPETSMMVQSSKQRTKAKKVVILHWYSVPNAMIQQKEVNDFLQEKKIYHQIFAQP